MLSEPMGRVCAGAYFSSLPTSHHLALHGIDYVPTPPFCSRRFGRNMNSRRTSSTFTTRGGSSHFEGERYLPDPCRGMQEERNLTFGDRVLSFGHHSTTVCRRRGRGRRILWPCRQNCVEQTSTERISMDRTARSIPWCLIGSSPLPTLPRKRCSA